MCVVCACSCFGLIVFDCPVLGRVCVVDCVVVDVCVLVVDWFLLYGVAVFMCLVGG